MEAILVISVEKEILRAIRPCFDVKSNIDEATSKDTGLAAILESLSHN
jgi:hypothetical protein